MNALKPYLEGKSHLIWDWNGTLLNDVEMVVEAMGHVLREQNLPTTTVQAYREIFGFPVSEYYRRLGLPVEGGEFERISEQFVARYLSAIRGCELHVGVRELLQESKTVGHTQSILSAAHEVKLREHLKHFGIHDYFDHIYGLADHHAKGKIERGHELIRAAARPLEQTVLIGDTDHDLEVGKALGIDVILLGDGHQSYERLAALHSKVLRNRHHFEGEGT